jgi:predicted TIM-barrel fold metal-dependent hydrolase
MHNGQKVVDVHGHMTTPAPFRQFLAETVAQNTPGRKLEMTEEQLENAQQRHLKFMDDRNIDVQFIGPRPIAMWHWMRPFLQDFWCRTVNDVIARIVKLHPTAFAAWRNYPKARKRIRETAWWSSNAVLRSLASSALISILTQRVTSRPRRARRVLVPLYEKAQQLDVPVMVHPSSPMIAGWK